MKNIPLPDLYYLENPDLKQLFRIMRISIFLLFFCLFSLMAENSHSQNARVTINRSDAPLESILNEIESQTDYLFIYKEDVNVKMRKSIHVSSKPVAEVLSILLAESSVAYKMAGNHIILTRNAALAAQQQKLGIAGTVTDASGEVLIGVSVLIKGSGQGTVTDLDGNFSLAANMGDILQFSYTGYIPQEIKLKDNHSLSIVLKEDVKSLDEVVVVAYGTQTKRAVTGAMETLDFDKLSDVPVAQFTQKMQGQIAGVQVNQGTGVPGQGMNVRIRGAASLSTGSNPLYVVDGFPIVGDINDINPNEIESMTILKDAAATSLYGSRAAFGVVLIQTKGAKAGKTNISFNAYMGVQNVPQKGRPEMMNGTEWAQFKKESYEDLGQSVPTAFQNPSQYGKGHDWYDAMLRSAMIQDYNVSVSTGKDKFTSSFVLGYFNQDGVLLNSDYQRISARANSTYRISDNLKLAFNLAPTYSFENRPSSDGAFFSGGRFPDIAPLGGGFGGLLWGSAGITVPWECYQQYGDKRLLNEHYDAMSQYIQYILDKMIEKETGLLVQNRAWGDLGDWLGLEDEKNDKSLLWEAYFIYDLELMNKIATILGKQMDAERFSKLYAERKTFFNKTYIRPNDGKTIFSSFLPKKRGTSIDIQTSYVLPLAFNIINDEQKEKAIKNLLETITRENTTDCGKLCPSYSLMTGFIGTAWIGKALSDNGYSDIAYRLLQQTSYPSWLYSVEQGATTIWERLNSYTHLDGFGGNNRMNSFNHYSFGAVGSWMYNYSLGIQRDEAFPGFKHFILKPAIDLAGKMKYAKGYYDSMYGRIESGWEIENEIIRYTFNIPGNTSALLYLPASSVKDVKENGKGILKKSTGIKFIGENNGKVILELESGGYQFEVKK